ncbi:MAG: hypothetical protein F6K16_37520, partial [Symploca sp. SIO2B6]|nr:hypothetical protein [Symploca sp. SIO2B6]
MERSPEPIPQWGHPNKNPSERISANNLTNIAVLLTVLVVVLGILFRCINLGEKAYWVDEVHTVVRVAGHTKAEITAEQFDNQIHSVAEFNQYQYPLQQPPLAEVLRTLAQHPEHPPLYYLLARWWVQGGQRLGINAPVTMMRSLSVLLGILVLPGVVALCRELFYSEPHALWTTAIALSIFALSPLHCLYAQEAREYSLWTLMTILSCWSFLKAIRLNSIGCWTLYSLSLVVGWYSHLLFATVIMAQGLYVALIRPQLLAKVGGAIALSLVAFSPWIVAFITNLGQVQAVVDATQRSNFFRENCLNASPIQIEEVDPTAAVIYPIVLED